MRTFFVLLVLFVATFGSQSRAETVYRPSDVRITLGSWTLTPIVVSVGDLSPRVHSFLAFVDKNQVSGQNLTSVWFVRRDPGVGGWQAFAWEGTDQWQAISYINSVLSIAPAYDAVWRTSDPKPDVMPSSPEVPKEYDNGVLVIDPLSAYLSASSSRDALVEVLVSLGYKAADIPFEKFQLTDQCEGDEIIDDLTQGVEADEAIQGDAGGVFIASNGLAVTCGTVWCLPWTWVVPSGPWGGWVNTPDSTLTGDCTLGTPPNQATGCRYRVTHTRYRPMTVYHQTPLCVITIVRTFNISECYTIITCCPNPGGGPCTPCLWATTPAPPPPGLSPSWICF